MNRMIRAACLAITVILIFAVSADAQNNPPTFVEIFDTDTISEGGSVFWFISVTDIDSADSHDLYMDPPTSDPGFKSYAIFGDVDDTTKNFQFNPLYDFITAGDTTLAITFYATDYIDTISMLCSITVAEKNPKPVLAPISNDTVFEGVLFELLVSATDPDGSAPTLEVDLSAAPLITTADFVDSGNGRGVFSFTPDPVHYGDSVLDHLIYFRAIDSIAADSIDENSFTLTVRGPNYEPAFADLDTVRTVVEGDILSIDLIASDPNGTFPVISFDTLLDSMFLDISDTGYALFEFKPDYLMYSLDSVVQVTFYADDGKSTDTLNIHITVSEAGNQNPVFDLPPPFAVAESEDVICIDSSSVLITAFDPEGAPVEFDWFWDDSLLGAVFDTASFTRDTLRITICPACYEGGAYKIPLKVYDDSLMADTADTTLPPAPGEDSIGFSFAVAEVNYPPELEVFPPESESISEGQRLRIDWSVFDSLDEGLQVDIFPPPDSSLFKGSMSSANYGDSGFLEFSPDFNFVDDVSKVITLKFTTADACETVIKEKVITVYDVGKDPNDPGEPDTLTMVGAVWDETLLGFKLTTRIWNDSAIAAGMTGFRWFDSWLECDSIVLGPRLDSVQYLRTYIYNDSLTFLVTFIYFDSLYLAPGEGEYFTAYFTYRGEQTDFDPVLLYDTAKVGSSGEFFFDKRIREKSYKGASADDLVLSSTSPYTYKPLIIFGDVRAAYDSVSIKFSDMAKGISLGQGDTVYVLDDQGEPNIYNLRLNFENKELLDSMGLGFRIYSVDGVLWAYQDPSTYVVPTSRMYPDIEVWQGSAGLQVTPVNMDGLLEDTLYLTGASGVIPDGGLTPGLMEYMVSLPLTVGGVAEDEVKNICFDIVSNDTTLPWRFVTKSGVPVTPGFSGSICFPVSYNPPVDVDDDQPAIPEVYSLGQNYPNPFNPSTTIRFSTAHRGEVKIIVYNILGQVVANLADRTFEAGAYCVTWDGRDQQGHPAASGIYLYHMISEGLTETKKMILLR